MFTNTKIALAAALILGSASAALATAGENAEGGTPAKSWHDMRQLNHTPDADNSYGFGASSTDQEDPSQSRRKIRSH